jgi:two-component system OmpR family response regulator
MASLLVVEDDFNMRLLITTILKMAGHDIFSAENGRYAVAHLQESCRFDLIISDILMPEMNGLEFLDWARRLCPSTPIMMLTVHARHDWIQETLRKGAACYLLKPFTKEHLIMAVEDILKANPSSNDSGQRTQFFTMSHVLAPL